MSGDPYSQLQKIYKSNSDFKVRKLAKQILKATGWPLESEDSLQQ